MYDLIDFFDELPLWSAPFGLKLLDAIPFGRQSSRILDIGSGSGFPALELAQRFGDDSHIWAVDPWQNAVDLINRKCKHYNINNVTTVCSEAELMPFEDSFFDLIVSNNGINNVSNISDVARQCYRVAANVADLIITYNLDSTMHEFYDIFRQVSAEDHKEYLINNIDKHIHSKRLPVAEMTDKFCSVGFSLACEEYNEFSMLFKSATAFFNHFFIRNYFVPSWKKLIENSDQEMIFSRLFEKIEASVKANNYFQISIPFACLTFNKHI